VRKYQLRGVEECFVNYKISEPNYSHYFYSQVFIWLKRIPSRPFKFRSPVTDIFEELAKICVTFDRYEKWQKA